MLLTCVLIWVAALCAAPGGAVELELAGDAGVLLEMRSGKVLWEHNKDLPVPPASTTKIITALVVLEKTKLNDMVTVPVEATTAAGPSAELEAGERLTVDQLLHGMMLRSANDATIALARHVGGTSEKFVALMHEKARQIGALQTSFRNPTGLPQEGHMTTAHDLALITKAALQTAEFRRIVAKKDYPWKSASWQGTLKNTNALLSNYPGAIGVKTGQTTEAGRVYGGLFHLVAAAERRGERFVAVVLKSTQRGLWQDAKNLLDHGFGNFYSMSLIERGETVLTSVVAGRTITIAAAEPAQYVGPAVESDPPQMQIALNELELPIAKGEKVGEAIFRIGDKELGRVMLVANAAVPEGFNMIWLTTGASVLFLALLLIWRKRQRWRNRHIFGSQGNRLRF
jgi:D-alanyl-D-alanine carboxypeptidase (penicillin-binding protein 5/6)